jgi:hypothetical protein
MKDTTPNTTPHLRAHYPAAAEQELKNARDYVAGQGAVSRAREAEVKREAALSIYRGIQLEVKKLDAYDVPLSDRVRIMRQVRSLEELVNL